MVRLDRRLLSAGTTLSVWSVLSVVLFPLWTASCGGPTQVGSCPRRDAVDLVPPTRTDGHLPTTAQPELYRLSFTIDPTLARFEGHASIDVSIPTTTRHFVLHGRSLHIREARGKMLGETDWHPASTTSRLSNGGIVDEELVVSFDQPMVGKAVFDFSFDAPFDDELLGIYKTSENGHNYVLSQFEAVEARRAFPCFDEPRFKTPFELTVEAPTGFTILSNTAEVERTTVGSHTRVRFSRTPPLPTYLVALAIGEFDVVDGAAAHNGKLPLRVAASKGKAHLGKSALETTRIAVDGLSDYFDSPHPYPKLDLVAFPDFSAGAMENPGLITFREQVLLLDQNNRSAQAERSHWLVVTHELAHQWFGNSVTTAWWDDLWLNEGFAMWMEARILEKLKPELQTAKEAAFDSLHVMSVDSFPSVRAVRQPVRSSAEAAEAFDAITYSKGRAILGMLENWIGRDAFRDAIRVYTKAFAGTSVNANDFFSVMERETKKPVSRVASPFVDVPGVPLLSFALKCDSNGARLSVHQSTYRPAGFPAAPAADWTIPACVRHSNTRGQECFIVDRSTESLPLSANTCPSWVHPNAHGAGYFRFDFPEADWKNVFAHLADLDVAEKGAALASLHASVNAGNVKPAMLLQVLPLLDREMDVDLTEQIVRVLDGVSRTFVNDASRPAFRSWVTARLSSKKKALGWGENAANEPSETISHRRAVLYAMADLADDAETRKEAEALTQRWLKDPRSLPSDTAALALDIASRNAPKGRVAQLRDALPRASSPAERTALLKATTGFDDNAALADGLSLMLTDSVKMQDLRYTIDNAGHRAATAHATRAWVFAHWDELTKKFTGSLGRYFVALMREVCTEAALNESKTFYSARVKTIDGAERAFKEGIDQATACIALRQMPPLTSSDFAPRK